MEVNGWQIAGRIGRLINDVFLLAKNKSPDYRAERYLQIMRLLKEILQKFAILRRYQNNHFNPDEFEVIMDIVLSHITSVP